MTQDALNQLLKDITKVRVAVVGDYCLDVYWFIDRSRAELSLETGVETRPIREQRYTLGGSGNVVMNFLDMGIGKVHVFGVTGADPFGQEMRRLLANPRVDASGLLTQAEEWHTHVYVKPYIGDAEQNRLDFGNFNRISEASQEALIASLERTLKSVDVVVINEQWSTGIHGEAGFRDRLQSLIDRHPDRLFILDSRHYSATYEGTVRKINDHEAARLCGITRAPDALILYEEARHAAETLTARWKKPVVVTRGRRGCLVTDGARLDEVPGLLILGRTDTVGAGDSMLAGLAAARGAGCDNLTAATFGNCVAGVTVQKLFQTGTASPAEILAIGTDSNYVYRPELAEDSRHARYWQDSEIEIVTAIPPKPSITHAIFDHDGTISSLRQGWEVIMEPMMVRAILGERYGGADESLYLNVVQRVREYINKTTGIQTITQMKGLVAMVKEFGCVPESQIQDAAGYKAIYNAHLMEVVEQRIAKLRRGELSADDFVIKNAPQVLDRLHAAGVKLYLASGTDEDDVRREAEALGYADLFEGRIYGAVGTVAKDAKVVVLERILKDVGADQAKHLVAFGDGPVEIRETHKRGGLTIGVASDEVRRFGLNTEKRSRLIQAGADALVPDFSQADVLMKLLGIP